jgi:Cu/Ag efflux protein CusF
MQTRVLVPASLLLVASLAQAQMSGMAMSSKPATSASATVKMSEGEVLKIDPAKGLVTLRHGPLENLGMPGMTMMFPVADKKALAALHEGDKVRFVVDRQGDTLVVVRIERR